MRELFKSKTIGPVEKASSAVLLVKILLVFCFLTSNLFASNKILPVIAEPKALPGGGSGTVSTGYSNFKTLDYEKYKDKEVLFTLSDGTEVGGLFFERKNSKKLLIGTFGFLSDRWSSPSAQFVEEYIEKNRIHSNVLILDHPTSAPYYALNGYLSFGGYDEARAIIEITEHILGGETILPRGSYASIHLIGISMGGNGVFNTLVESKRLGKNYYKSAAIFSSVLDLYEIPKRQLSGFDKNNYWGKDKSTITEVLGVSFIFNHFKQTFKTLTDKYFKSPYDDLGEFYYKEFDKRIRFLNEHSKLKNSNWNDKISTADVSSYLKSNIIYDKTQEIEVPLYVISSQNDPAVPFSQFEKFETQSRENPNITTLGLEKGGHWGFTHTYGPSFVHEVMRNVLSVE